MTGKQHNDQHMHLHGLYFTSSQQNTYYDKLNRKNAFRRAII